MTKESGIHIHTRNPSNNLLSEMKDKFVDIDEIKIVTGFISKPGLELIENTCGKTNFEKIKKTIIVGFWTDSAEITCKYFDEGGKKKIFYIGQEFKMDGGVLHPRIHAKIIVGLFKNQPLWAYIGSANITEPALTDENVEGNVFIMENALLKDINDHVDQIKNYCSPYPTNNKIKLKQTDEGAFTYVFDWGDSYYHTEPKPFILIALSNKEEDFIKNKSLIVETTTIETGTNFNNLMKKTDKFGLVIFCESLRELHQCKFFVKPCISLLSNAAHKHNNVDVIGATGFLVYQRNKPFIYYDTKPSNPVEKRQVAIKVYDKMADLLLDNTEVQFNNDNFKDLLNTFIDKPNKRCRILKNIYLGRKKPKPKYYELNKCETFKQLEEWHNTYEKQTIYSLLSDLKERYPDYYEMQNYRTQSHMKGDDLTSKFELAEKPENDWYFTWYLVQKVDD